MLKIKFYEIPTLKAFLSLKSFKKATSSPGFALKRYQIVGKLKTDPGNKVAKKGPNNPNICDPKI